MITKKNYIYKILSFVLILLFVNTGDAYSQRRGGGNSKKNKENDAFANFKDRNYEVALKQFLKLYKKDKLNVLYNYNIGVCYLYSYKERAKAIDFLRYAEMQEGVMNEVYFNLGKAYFYNEDFDKAEEYYQRYYELDKSVLLNDEYKNQEYENFIRWLKNAKKHISKPKNIEFIALSDNINTDRNEYLPFLNLDETHLYYVTDKKYVSFFQEYIESIYMSENKRDKWTKGKSVGSKINTNDENERIVGISFDEEVMLIKPDNYLGFQDIYMSKKYRGRFMEIENMGPFVNTNMHESGACLTVNKDTLYFASDREGGYGGLDIYRSIKLPNGEWSDPQNLGTSVNSEYDEDYPRISYDGKTLYFASKGYDSMGGYDLFKTEWNTDRKRWSLPVNLGFPINDMYDNTAIAFSDKGRYAYVSKFIPDKGEGNLDIFMAIFKDEEERYATIAGEIAAGDSLHKTPLKDVSQDITISVINVDTDEEVGEWAINERTSRYVLSLLPGKYEIVIEGAEYVPYKEEIEITESIAASGVIAHDIYLTTKTQEQKNKNPYSNN